MSAIDVQTLHPFDLPPKDAIQMQRWLAERVVTTGRFKKKLKLVAGVDCSPSPGGVLHASIVVCEPPDWDVLEEVHASATPRMPYIPGLLSFRELPIVLEAMRRLKTRPDVILVDGQGLAHPRRMGLATHLGLHIDVPTIGVGKSRLCGTHGEPGPESGEWTPLMDKGRRIGLVVRTRDEVKPVYVSVGNNVGLLPAARVVLATCTRFRLPNPIRHADRMSRALARMA
ncbi:MAG: deoxyribonuclease V [Planctomycetota bacterium]|nr:deoxyribonuclease V [Planctomycetota bacterium]